MADTLPDPVIPVDGDLAGRLRLVVTRLARRLRQEGSSGLTPSQGSALATVEREGPVTPSALAVHERIQRPTATRLLAALERDGLVVREGDPTDGRVTRVSLSPEGRRVLRRLRGRKQAYLERRLRGLDDEERATLERAAAILERVLRDER